MGLPPIRGRTGLKEAELERLSCDREP